MREETRQNIEKTSVSLEIERIHISERSKQFAPFICLFFVDVRVSV